MAAAADSLSFPISVTSQSDRPATEQGSHSSSKFSGIFLRTLKLSLLMPILLRVPFSELFLGPAMEVSLGHFC